MRDSATSESDWIKETLHRYGEAEKSQPPFPGFDENWPEWVSKLLVNLMGVSHPGLKLKEGQKWKAKELGAFLGRQYALDAVFAGEVTLDPKIHQEVDQVLVKVNPSRSIIDAATKYAEQMEEWRPRFKQFMEESLTSARGRPYLETSAFLEAFGKASVIRADDFITERKIGVSERIAWTMVMLWPVMAKLESVAQLHDILSKAFKQIGVVIEYRRIEKLCQRIGLKFKGPGRPKKKTQTKSKSP